MKANLYVQGRFWASIDIPGDSLLALMAQGMITRAACKGQQLAKHLNDLEGIQCSISLRYKQATAYEPDTEP